jgi:hypothetical protein
MSGVKDWKNKIKERDIRKVIPTNKHTDCIILQVKMIYHSPGKDDFILLAAFVTFISSDFDPADHGIFISTFYDNC